MWQNDEQNKNSNLKKEKKKYFTVDATECNNTRAIMIFSLKIVLRIKSISSLRQS